MSRKPDWLLVKSEMHLILTESLHKECRRLARLGRTHGWTLSRVVESALFENELLLKSEARQHYAHGVATTWALRMAAADGRRAPKRRDVHVSLDRRVLAHLDELHRMFPGLFGARSAAARLVLEHTFGRYLSFGVPEQRRCCEEHMLDVLEEVHARAMNGEL